MRRNASRTWGREVRGLDAGDTGAVVRDGHRWEYMRVVHHLAAVVDDRDASVHETVNIRVKEQRGGETYASIDVLPPAPTPTTAVETA